MTNDNSNQNLTADEKFLLERFNVMETIGQDRANEICNCFVAEAIKQFENGSFEKSTLNYLTYNELCCVYSNIGWFVAKAPANVKSTAVEYKKMLRRVLLNRISTIELYVLYSKASNLPFINAEGAILVFTTMNAAQDAVEESELDWIEVREIDSESFDRYFCEYFCTGYNGVRIDGITRTSVSELYEIENSEAYGNICPEACMHMINYKQIFAIANSKARKEGREFTENEKKLMSGASWAASSSLMKSNLLVPAEMENGAVKEIKTPLVSMPNGKKFIAFFTDHTAINGFFQKVTSCVAIADLLKKQYEQLKNDSSIEGVVINPGREEYIITAKMLSDLVAAMEKDEQI